MKASFISHASITNMLGRRAIYSEYLFTHPKSTSKQLALIVQANKHYGICKIIVAEVKEVKDDAAIELKPIPQLGSKLLSDFQGRQFNDGDVYEHLVDTLIETLNSEE